MFKLKQKYFPIFSIKLLAKLCFVSFVFTLRRFRNPHALNSAFVLVLCFCAFFCILVNGAGRKKRKTKPEAENGIVKKICLTLVLDFYFRCWLRTRYNRCTSVWRSKKRRWEWKAKQPEVGKGNWFSFCFTWIKGGRREWRKD